jgi:hypothetical protein
MTCLTASRWLCGAAVRPPADAGRRGEVHMERTYHHRQNTVPHASIHGPSVPHRGDYKYA